MTTEERLQEYKNALTDAHNINLEAIDDGVVPSTFMYRVLLLKAHHLKTGKIFDFEEENERIKSLNN